MSEPFLERLSGFTPDAGGLDRDALLFAAGRSSARPNRYWVTLASVLAGTQALSLALIFWPHPAAPTGAGSTPIVSNPAPASAEDGPARGTPVSPGIWLSPNGSLVSEADEPAVGSGNLIDSGPPLRAFAQPPSSVWN